MEKKIELPYGKTEGYIKSMIEAWDHFDKQVKQNDQEFISCNPEDFDEYYEDDEYIDRYFYDDELGDCVFCVSTEKATGKNWLSEKVSIAFENGEVEYYWINELREMICK